LQANKENEKRAMRERERKNEQLERDRIAGEEERKRQEQLKKDEEVGERQERQRKKEDQLRRDRLNPIPATLEHVNNYPEKFYGRILCFDKVKVSGGSIKGHKDLRRFNI